MLLSLLVSLTFTSLLFYAFTPGVFMWLNVPGLKNNKRNVTIIHAIAFSVALFLLETPMTFLNVALTGPSVLVVKKEAMTDKKKDDKDKSQDADLTVTEEEVDQITEPLVDGKTKSTKPLQTSAKTTPPPKTNDPSKATTKAADSSSSGGVKPVVK